MKLIMAIVNHDDTHHVTKNLTHAGFQVTRLATTGGFLMAGNTTILVGVDDDKVDSAISIIREFSHSRKQLIPTTSELGIGFYPTMPIEVTVGGATVFVLDVDRFEKM